MSVKIEEVVVKGRVPRGIRINKTEFNELWAEHPEELGKVKINNNVISTPRWQQSYIYPYYFSGMDHAAKSELPSVIPRLKEWIDGLGYGKFNQVLINWYKDGSHYIGAHSDDETQLEPGSPIAIVSLGATRTFRVHKRTGQRLKDYEVMDGDYVVMLSPMQTHYKHSIVKVTGKRSREVDKRISVTFRKFKQKNKCPDLSKKELLSWAEEHKSYLCTPYAFNEGIIHQQAVQRVSLENSDKVLPRYQWLEEEKWFCSNCFWESKSDLRQDWRDIEAGTGFRQFKALTGMRSVFMNLPSYKNNRSY